MISSYALLKIFKSSRFSCIILSPDAPCFTIAEVNTSYLKCTCKKESEIIGKTIFEIFANDAETDGANNNFNLRQSLNTVIQTKALHKINAQKLTIYSKAAGAFEEKYFEIENAPLLNDQSEIEYIVQTITEVTTDILLRKNNQLPEVVRSEGLSDQAFKSLIHNGINLIGVIDKDSKYKYVSPTFFTILGIDPNDLIGNTSGEYIHPEDKERVLSSYAKLQTCKKIKIPPFRFKHKNGTWRWLETVVIDLRDDPAVNGIVTNSTDVTKKIETEKELKNSEEKYKLLFQFSPIPKWFYDLDSHKILGVNDSAIEHYGFSRKEFLSMTIKDLRPEDEMPKLLKAIEKIKGHKGLMHFGTFIHHQKDGTAIKVEVSGHRFEYNHTDCMMAACVDVTERENALQQLREDESKLLAAQKIAKLGYWQLKLDQNTLYWSDEVYTIWGVTRETFETSPDSFFETMHPDDRNEFLKYQAIALADEKELDFEHRILLPDGSVKWVHERGKLVKNAAAEPVFFEGSVQDITSAKLLEKSLEESNLRYQYVSKATSDVIWDWDFSTETVYWGENFEIIFGYNLKDLQSSSEFWEDHIHPEDRDAILNGIETCMKGTDLNWANEYRFLKADNTYAYVSDKGFFIRDNNDKAIRMVGAMEDITKRKNAEDELLQFKKIIENSQNGVRIGDKSGNVIYLNPAFVNLLGYNVEMLKKMGGIEKIYVDIKQAKEVSETIYGGKNWNGEIELYNIEGNIISAYLNAGPVFDDKGNLIAVYGIHTNINELKKAEQKLQEAYNERNNILESIGDVFFAVDKNWTVTYWNRMAEKILRKPKEEILGKNLWKEYDFGKDTIYFTNFQRALKENIARYFEVNIESINTSFEVSVFPSLNGLSIYFKDVTERRQAIEKIRLSNERFERVTKATNDAIWDLDFDNNTLYLGEGFGKLRGDDYYKEIHSADNWLAHIHPDDRPDIESRIKKALQSEEVSFLEGEYRYMRQNGTFAFIIARASIIRDESGNAKRIVGAFSDMTQRKEYEASLKRLNEDLAKINRELVASNTELEQFAYIASHDLQEPLRMITSFLSQIEKKYGNLIDEKGKQYIYFAVDGAKRMRQIILDLLEFSRVGRMQINNTEKVDLNDLINGILLLFQKQIEETGAKIEIQNLPIVETFKAPLRQVFQNLISNALKYKKKNEPPFITISSKENSTHWLFSVADNGIGIDAEYHDKIFIIFQRLHNKDEYSGTGIGLAIVKKIVDSLGGTIWVDSREEKGSTFFFSIKK